MNMNTSYLCFGLVFFKWKNIIGKMYLKAISWMFHLLSLVSFQKSYNITILTMNHHSIFLALSRILKVSTYLDEKVGIESFLSPHNLIRLLQHLILLVYEHHVPWRPAIRKLIAKYMFNTLHGSCNLPSKMDGGQSRNHVQFLLQLLHSITAGLIVLQEENHHHETNQCRTIRYELLRDILIPLHLPNEMILWRDQTPILQLYHEELVRCLVALVESDHTRAHFSATLHAKGSTLLTEAIVEILLLWPDAFNTNTPKQVLLLHELEILIDRCHIEEFKVIQHKFLVSYYYCFLFAVI